MPKQQQQQKQVQKETQQELQFFVHQDLENVLGILAETSKSFQLLEKHTDQSYIPIAHNRLILQTNLSNAIQYDQYLNYEKNPDLAKQLIEEKKIAKERFEKIVYDEKLIDVSNPILQEICKHYLNNNLSEKNLVSQLNPVQVKTKASFNAETVQKIIGGIQSVDQQIQEIKKGNYQPPTVEDLKAKIQARQTHCEQQLRKNFNIPSEEQQNQQQKGQSQHNKMNLTKPPLIGKEEEEDSLINFSDEEKNEKSQVDYFNQKQQEGQTSKTQQDAKLLDLEGDPKQPNENQFDQAKINENSSNGNYFLQMIRLNGQKSNR